MDHILVKIKRLILQGRYEFRLSAEIQLANDGLAKEDTVEAILNAAYIAKKNPTSQDKLNPKESLYDRKLYVRWCPDVYKRCDSNGG